MADLEWQGEPDRPSLRRAVRHRLRQFEPALRVVAEGFLAESSEIDLLALGAEGELVSVRIGRPGDDARRLTQALSDLTWLRARREHLLKLAPGLGLEPSAEPRAFLLSPAFAAETISAAENLPSRTIRCLRYRGLRVQGQLTVLLTDVEAESPGAAPQTMPGRSQSDLHGNPSREAQALPPLGGGALSRPPGTERPSPLTDPPSPSGFRTGLSDADLGRPTQRVSDGEAA